MERSVATREEYYGTGRRKNSVARVWLRPGTGRVVVNARDLEDYLHGRLSLIRRVREPLALAKVGERYDVLATAKGGGVSGQAGALCHGIARALLTMDESFRGTLKGAGLLTRDPRAKERKKFGRKRARRGFQFSKR